MTIGLDGDLLMEVTRAADPRRAGEAARRLDALADPATSVSFATIAAARPPAVTNAGDGADRADAAFALSARNPHVAKPLHAAEAEAMTGLGAILLQKMIEQMTPKPASTSFGSGSAGALWRSTLAERLAAALAPGVFGAAATAPTRGKPNA